MGLVRLIFSGQEKPLIILKSKERNIIYMSKEMTKSFKIAEIMKTKEFLTSFILGGALNSIFNFLKY